MKIRTKPEPYCPDCGARMTLRRPRENATWVAFWGCSRYPICKGTRQIDEDGKPESDDMADARRWNKEEDKHYLEHPDQGDR